MPFAERVGDKIHIKTSYHERHLVKMIPGARYDKDEEVWKTPLTWAACITARGIFGNDLDLGEELVTWAFDTRDKVITPALALRDALTLSGGGISPDLDTIEADRPLKLFPYQRVDAEFMATNRQVLLANPPGLGKTGATIRALQLMSYRGIDTFPVVVICPNSLKFTVWEEGFRQWAPEISVRVIDGGAVKRRKQLAETADAVVINWESVRLHSKLAPYGTIALTESEKQPKELNGLSPNTVIFDEAHKLKDPQAKQTRASWAVAHGAKNIFALTGTPVADHIGDLWGLLHAIKPDWYPSKTKFLDRYAQISHNYWGGSEVIGIKPETKNELFSIVDPLMRRVPKEAALPQLPAKLPVQYRHTPMSAKQQKLYDQMKDMMVAQLPQLLVAPNPLSQLTRLIQFASASAELNEAGEIRLSDPSSKVDDMMELLEEMGEEPLVVGAVSRQLIELASRRLDKHKVPHGLVTGAQSPLERQLAVKEFQEGKSRVILLTLGAGAEGLTLTRASTMLFLQRSWSEIQNQQAEDRVHRIGSEHHAEVRIIEQITPNSVEEHRRELLEGKQMRMEDVVRDAESLKKLLGVV